MRMKLTLALGLVVLAVLNFGIYRNERFIEAGEEVYFELAPVDPRSLLQGDYMRLNYRIANDLRQKFARIRSAGEGEVPRIGKVVVRLDERRVASFERIWRMGETLGDKERLADQHRLRVLLLRGRAGQGVREGPLWDLQARQGWPDDSARPRRQEPRSDRARVEGEEFL